MQSNTIDIPGWAQACFSEHPGKSHHRTPVGEGYDLAEGYSLLDMLCSPPPLATGVDYGQIIDAERQSNPFRPYFTSLGSLGAAALCSMDPVDFLKCIRFPGPTGSRLQESPDDFHFFLGPHSVPTPKWEGTHHKKSVPLAMGWALFSPGNSLSPCP